MRFSMFIKTGAALLALAVILPSSLCGAGRSSVRAAETANYNYATALRDSIIFYDANKCGPDAGVNNFFDSPCPSPKYGTLEKRESKSKKSLNANPVQTQ